MTMVFKHARALQLLSAGSGNPTAEIRDGGDSKLSTT